MNSSFTEGYQIYPIILHFLKGLMLFSFLGLWIAEPMQTFARDLKESNNSVVVIVDNTKQYQTMEGFGVTHGPLVHEGRGDVLGPELRARAIDAVYNQVGITTGNLEGGLLESAAGWERRANDNDDPFHFNWKGFQTSRADAMKRKVIDLAQPLGFDNYFLGQKINVRWASPWLDHMRTKDYQRYLDEAAEQVAAGHIYWRDKYGIVPRYQMFFNEPLSGNRELLNGTVQDVVNIVKRSGARLRREGFRDIRVVIPNEETEEKSLSTAASILSDPEARQFVGAIGYHTYPYGSAYASIPKILRGPGTGRPDPNRIAVRNKLRDLGKQYGIPVWMTEVSHGEVDPRSFDALRGRAIHIHDELIYADAAAYFGMNNMWDAISHQLHFGDRDRNFFASEGGIVLIDNNKKAVYITGMGYAIGHYARWVKRGAVRIEATSSDPSVQVTAFRHDGQKRIVMVIINNGSTNRTLNVNLVDLTLDGALSLEQSTASARWQLLSPRTQASPTAYSLVVPAESVTTVIGQTKP